MNQLEAISRAGEILSLAQLPSEEIPAIRNFLEYGSVVAHAARALTSKQKSGLGFDLKEWALVFRELYDQWDRVVAADPMVAYEPANSAALEFHKSQAYIRYFRAGNRTSKSQSGYAEHYFIATGQHRWRKFAPPPASTFIVAGLPFTSYADGIFARKFLTGEDGNALSPMFPEGGKWFNHYDDRSHTITIACPQCASEGRAGVCKHPKSTIKLFSNENGWEVLQGAAYTLGHFDEHVDETFFDEARQRTGTTGGCLIVTGTPLHGYEAWEHRRLTSLVLDGPPANLTVPSNPNSPPIVSLHQVSMYDAGLVPKETVDREASLLDEFEKKARIMGEPAPLAKNPVFDRSVTSELKKICYRPARGSLLALREDGVTPIPLNELGPDHKLKFEGDGLGSLRIWKAPEADEVYIVAVDTASGLLERVTSGAKKREGDASCASVLRVYPKGVGVGVEMVAQWHGWITPYDYADEVMKLCVYYNSALCVVELTGGLGIAVVQRLRNDHCYWNIYREPQDRIAVEQRLDSRLGVDTNASTKPFMVSALKQFLKERRLVLYDDATIEELNAFEQITTGAGGAALSQPKYMGAGGAKDDRVMSLAIGAAVIISYPLLSFQIIEAAQKKLSDGATPTPSKQMTAVYKELALEKQDNDFYD